MSDLLINKFITGNYQHVIKRIISVIFSKKKQSISILPISLNDFANSEKKANKTYYENLDYLVPDGMPIAWWLKYFKGKKTQRIYGPNMTISILSKDLIKNKKHFFLSPNLSNKKMLENAINTNYIHLENTMCLSLERNGKDNINFILKEITQFKPDLIWIGIGSPRQVEIAHKIKSVYKSSTIFCVGAAFSILTGQQIKTPKILQNLGLEWLFRLLTEPQRLWKRYLVDIPIYLILKINKKIAIRKKN